MNFADLSESEQADIFSKIEAEMTNRGDSLDITTYLIKVVGTSHAKV